MKIESSMLKRLGPVPFWRGERRCLDALEEIYRRAQTAALRVVPRPNQKSPLISEGQKGYTMSRTFPKKDK